MKVLLLGPYPPPHGGVEVNLAAIRRFLLKRNIPCEVVNLTRFRNPRGEGIYCPSSALEVLSLILRLRFDLVHLHIGGNVTLRLLALGFFCSLLPGRRAVLTLHSGGYPRTPQGRNAHPHSWRGFLFRRFDRIIAVNGEIRAMFERFGVPSARIREICPFAFPGEDSAEPFPGELECFLQAHAPLLVTVSGLEPQYDLPLQIEVLGAVRERYPRAGLVIVGGGILENELRARIRSSPWGEHIFMSGDLPHSMTLRAVAAADVFLRTTLYDGDAISVREALHLGTPVIATDNGMRPGGVRLFPVSDRAALLEAIVETLDRGRPPRPGSAGDDANLQAVLDLYREIVT